MRWYEEFAERYLGVKYDSTFVDFVKFAVLPFIVVTGIIIFGVIITN